MAEQTIICPKCGSKIPITETLRSQIEAELRPSFDAEVNKREKEIRAEMERQFHAQKVELQKEAAKEADEASRAEMSKLQKELEHAKKKQEADQEHFENRLADERTRVEREAKKEAEGKYSGLMEELRKKLKDKDEEVDEIRKRGVELEKQRRELEAREKHFDDEVKKKIDHAVDKAKRDAIEKTEDEFRSRELQLEKKLNDAKKDAADLKRKLEQASQQAQGEVEELELEDVLAKAFPSDEIEPVAKGKKGADILQKVYDPNKQYCGTIIWECKNTTTWSKAWLPKLRGDMRRAKAHIAILVSKALPKEVPHFAQTDGVWVTEYPLALGVGTALRITLIQAMELRQSLEGKHEKKKVEQLFDYLSGNEFRQRVEAIVEAFVTMQDDLEKEKQVIEKNWAKREKQLHLVLQNVSGMYGEFQGIIGQSLPRIRRLELLPD